MKIRKHRFYFFILLFAASSLLVHFPSDFEAFAKSDGSVDSTVAINDDTTNGPSLNNNDEFGRAITSMGDLDGDGGTAIALVVGARLDDAGSGSGQTNRGAVHIMFMNTNGSVDSTVEINDNTSNGPNLKKNDNFGQSAANIGDLNDDGVDDLVVGAPSDNGAAHPSPKNRGAVHIMFMNTNGSVDSTVEIDDTSGPTISNGDRFGWSVANIGDLDGDNINDIAVGARADDNGGSDRGAVHIMFMNRNGSVDSTVEINSSTTNGPSLGNNDNFGKSVTSMGDLDGDGGTVKALAVGASTDETVHIIFMNTDGSVDSTVEINSSTTNGPTIEDGDQFGWSVVNMGDLDGDGVNDLAVGERADETVHIIFMNTDGSVDSTIEINSSTTNGPSLDNNDHFGESVENIGDLDGNGVNDLAVGEYNDDAGGEDRGAVHIMFMHESTQPTVTITTSSGDCGDTVSSTTLSYTVTLSESVSDFTIDDITVTGTANGGSPEASNFAGSGTTYTFDVVKGSSDGTVLVSVGAGVATDSDGNVNTASNSCTFTIDSTAPTVIITSSTGDSGDTVSDTTLSFTATFSESVSNFVVGDITVTGTANDGSPEASNFAGSGTTYTFDVVQGSSDGTVSVSIAAGVAADAAGNGNTVSNTYMLTIDTAVTTASSMCTRHIILGNCGTIAINNDEYRIIDTWTNVPTTEVLVGQPVTVTLSTPNNPTHTKIHFASVHTEVFSIPVNFDHTAHIDYSPVSNQVTYVSQSQLFQVAGATHRIVQDSDVQNLEMFEVVFTMIFAKPMDTSHVVVETENKHGIPETLYLLDALKVNENIQQALTLEEKSKFELEYEPEVDPEPPMEPDMKIICGKGTVLKDNLCVPKEWSFLDLFEHLMKMFG